MDTNNSLNETYEFDSVNEAEKCKDDIADFENRLNGNVAAINARQKPSVGAAPQQRSQNIQSVQQPPLRRSSAQSQDELSRKEDIEVCVNLIQRFVLDYLFYKKNI